MAPSATATQSHTSKPKRPIPPGIQTNGIISSTSSPSPSMSAGRLLSGGRNPNSAMSNGVGNNMSGPRSGNRAQREPPSKMMGRGHRVPSGGLRSASMAGDVGSLQSSEPLPYVKTDEYILKKHRGQVPSLIIHLYTAFFKFDSQQEGNFSYKSPMRIVIEHLRKRTIPHELVEFMDVPFYDGCMIVQIHDHKSVAPSQDANRQNTAAGKSAAFSVHNPNIFLTPSPWVPYEHPLQEASGPSDGNQEDSKPKTAEQKDKENMPAPALPGEGHQKRLGTKPLEPKISTIVLHPTPLSNHCDFIAKGVDAITNSDGRRDSRVDMGVSATVPPTPSTALPQTPMTLAPPAKRLKKGKAELDTAHLYSAQSQIIFGTGAPLVLDPVNSAMESAALLKALEHPMHLEKPPTPKSRKRTVAEMAADEAAAADQERYMLLLDERLSSNLTGATGANPADGDGQTGSSSFEPRFERFKAIENIKAIQEEKLRQEKLKAEEVERKALQDRERDRLRLENEKKEREINQNKAQQVHQIPRPQGVQGDLHRRQQQQLAAQQAAQAQSLAGIPNQVQHAHPQTGGMVPNGMQGQPQRFHQQVSQAQVSSPIVRNNTPHNNSSPMNNMGNVPMQQSTSSMGGSPPRPGSVVHQNHANINAATSHPMTARGSQQSHAGTPRMSNATPNLQNTPLNRQISQTPRMSQGSPLPGQLAQAPQMQMMANGQPMNAQQQHALLQAQMNQRMNAMRQQNPQMMNAGMQMSPQQQQAMMMRQQMHNNPNYNPQMAQVMRQQQMLNNPNFMNGQNMQQPQNMMQQQQMQQMALNQQAAAQRAAVQAQAQAQAQAVQAHQVQNQQMMQAQQIFSTQVMQQAKAMYMKELPVLQQKYPGGIPEDIERQLKTHCQQQASTFVRTRRQQMQQHQQQQAQHQQQMMAAQQQMGGMPNGMGM